MLQLVFRTHCSGELMSFGLEASLSQLLFPAQIWASWVTDPVWAASGTKAVRCIHHDLLWQRIRVFTLRVGALCDDYRVCLSSEAETSQMCQKAACWWLLFPHPAAKQHNYTHDVLFQGTKTWKSQLLKEEQKPSVSVKFHLNSQTYSSPSFAEEKVFAALLLDSTTAGPSQTVDAAFSFNSRGLMNLSRNCLRITDVFIHTPPFSPGHKSAFQSVFNKLKALKIGDVVS